jgi:hypothetical protein
MAPFQFPQKITRGRRDDRVGRQRAHIPARADQFLKIFQANDSFHFDSG